MNDQKPTQNKIVAVLGCAGAGKATIMGSMVYKCGGIEMPIMERFQTQRYDQVLKELKAMGEPAYFHTPKNKVIISNENPSVADGVIIVVSPIGTSEQGLGKNEMHQLEELAPILKGKKAIVLINKLDAYDWSESVFTKTVKSIADVLGVSSESTPFIPVSGLYGDNLIEPSSKCSWCSDSSIDSRMGTGKGTTLLAAVEAMLS